MHTIVLVVCGLIMIFYHELTNFSLRGGLDWSQLPVYRQLDMYKIHLLMQKNQLLRDN